MCQPDLMRKPDLARRSHCPISYALDVFGDKWTLLIVRDLMFKGKRRYKEFADSQERIATNILADRLAKLEAEGLVTRAVDPHSARQRVYELTEAGLALAPILIEMILWSAKHDPESAAPGAFVRDARRNRARLMRSVLAAARANASRTLSSGSQ
jgi:DNA-binding HxlR family transcriptional regulator